MLAAPFQEGYLLEGGTETHVFTDYRWNNGVVWRDWKVDRRDVNLEHATIRPFSLEVLQKDGQ